MAWGGMGSRWGKAHVAAAWSSRHKLTSHLTKLRSGSLTRCDAYNLFANSPVPGIGPAYFTKLMYFFNPNPNQDHYIMDQWTAKSVNLLTGTTVVRIYGNWASSLNKCGNYLAYCHEIDEIAALLKIKGADVEEMLMSKGGLPRWRWRQYLTTCWPARSIAPYNKNSAYALYGPLIGARGCKIHNILCF